VRRKENKLKKVLSSVLFFTGLVFWVLSTPAKVFAAFRFVSWGDSRDNPGVLSSLSTQVRAMNSQPAFTIFNGDLCPAWSTTSTTCSTPIWVTDLNGSSGNGMSAITFVVRGNHDASSGTAWSNYFNQASVASHIGATNYSSLSADMTYSFDYQNVHIAGVDLPGGDVSSMSTAEITWLDSDLKAAENRGIQAEFLFWHGPTYYVDGHASTPPAALVTVLNNHPKILAIFNGHEHVIAHVTLDNTRISGLTNNVIEEFVTGTAGAPAYSCTAGRSDFCQNYNAFATIDVLSSNQFTVNFYKQGVTTPQYTKTFTKSPSPTGSAIPTITPTSSPTAKPSPTITPTPTPSTGPDSQPAFPVRAMFYYPWFPESWTQNNIYPYTKYHPTLGFYSTYDTNVISNQIAAMLYAKVNLGISSWWGQGHNTDTKFPLLLRGADGTNLRWAIYYEPEGQTNPTVSTIQNDLIYIRDHYGNDKNYYRINGRFVVFVYADATDACDMVDRWKQANTVNAYIVLKVFSGFSSCTNQPDSWHQYNPAVASDSQAGYSYTISPGFDKVGETTRLVRDLNLFQTNIRNMIASKAPFQLITTFNEWGEGSAVESATEWSSSSGYGSYLDALHNDGVMGSSSPTPINIPGDINHDGVVNIQDFTLLSNAFGTNNTAADINSDGIVNVQDYILLSNNFGKSS
jgi:hypothetical protein